MPTKPTVEGVQEQLSKAIGRQAQVQQAAKDAANQSARPAEPATAPQAPQEARK